MEMACFINCSNIAVARNPQGATKNMTDVLFNKIYPTMLDIRSKLEVYDGVLVEDDLLKIQNVYALCCSQIKKCLHTLFHIFKTEYHQQVLLQESRQCTLERLSWCVNRLLSIKQLLYNTNTEDQTQEESSNDSILVTPLYFVNWVDHIFDVLSNLANIVYRTDYKDSDENLNEWKKNVVDCVTTLHISVNELLLSAITLCKHCLPTDQHVIKARCQVVLREAKAVMGELIEADLDTAFKALPENLKLPIMPSNVNLLIDVLRDVLYALETNTNTALLFLLVHCFSNSISPVDVLKDHFVNSKETCSCNVKVEDDFADDCPTVKAFDLYNERLLQIGSFALSCSSDQKKMLTLRSGLASLEALDPHLVPALMLSPDSPHAVLLMNSWRQEVQDIRDSVFLIVDPAAFAEKAKQMINQTLLDIMKKSSYNSHDVCLVINIGCMVHEFFCVYNKHEPGALTHRDELEPLLANLNKVQEECKIVSNLLSSGDDFVYSVKTVTTNGATMAQLIKRLKLLYTLINRINSLLHPAENEDQLFDCEDEQQIVNKNLTHTVYANALENFTRKLPKNISRSNFARSMILRSSAKCPPLSKLTKHLTAKKCDELNFSLQIDELFNLSTVVNNKNHTDSKAVNKHLESIREPSILYNYSPKKRSSLRKAVLNRHCKLPFDMESENGENDTVSDKMSLMDEVTSLQVTDILNQMEDLTDVFSTTKSSRNDETYSFGTALQNHISKTRDIQKSPTNRLKININDGNATISKHIWNIPVNASTVEVALDGSAVTTASNVTLPSNVTTLERLNDIDLVESKLNSLKFLELETTL